MKVNVLLVAILAALLAALWYIMGAGGTVMVNITFTTLNIAFAFSVVALIFLIKMLFTLARVRNTRSQAEEDLSED
jgi:uncharacterized membrane protein